MTNKAKSTRKTKLNQSKTAASNEERTHAIDKGLRVTNNMSGRDRERDRMNKRSSLDNLMRFSRRV